jgi:hypothetical protein
MKEQMRNIVKPDDEGSQRKSVAIAVCRSPIRDIRHSPHFAIAREAGMALDAAYGS